MAAFGTTAVDQDGLDTDLNQKRILMDRQNADRCVLIDHFCVVPVRPSVRAVAVGVDVGGLGCHTEARIELDDNDRIVRKWLR